MRFHLPILVALSVAVHVSVIANTSVTARDSLGFARQAMNLAHPDRGGQGSRLDVLRNTHQPPGYPVAVYAAYCGVSAVWYAPLAEQLLLSTQVASALAGVLIVFPFYRLGRCLLNPAKAFGATAVYQLLPAVAKYTSDGLGESLFLLFAVTALWLAVSGLQQSRIWRFLAAGFAVGCAYLVRPEGLGVALAIAGTLGILAVIRHRKEWVIAVCWVGLGTVAVAVPYMAAIGGVTNKPAGKELYESARFAPPLNIHGALFAEFIPPDIAEANAARVTWCLRATGIEYLQATHYAVGVLASVALILHWRKLIAEPVWIVLIAFAAIHLGAVLTVVAYRHGYVSDRHLLPLVPVACLLAMRLFNGSPRRWGWITAAIAISCLPSLTKSLHENRAGHKYAGRYLATMLEEPDQLIDPFEWSAYYAGRTVYASPVNVELPTSIYAVLDDAKGEHPHPRLWHMPEAMQISRDPRSELVFVWPAGATEADAKVRVYRLKTYR